MNQFKGKASAAVAGMLCIVVGLAACGKSGSSSGLGSTGGSSSGGSGSVASAVAQTMALTGTGFGVVNASGVLKPRISVTVPCPTSGSISVTASPTISISGNSYAVSGTKTTSFNACVFYGYNINGTISDTFNNFTVTFSPSLSNPQTITATGAATVATNGVTLTGPGGINYSACAMNVNVTNINDSLSLTNYTLSGSETLNGTACGVTISNVTCTISSTAAPSCS